MKKSLRRDRMVSYNEQFGNVNLLLIELLPDSVVSEIINAAHDGLDAIYALPSKHHDIAYIVYRMLEG